MISPARDGNGSARWTFASATSVCTRQLSPVSTARLQAVRYASGEKRSTADRSIRDHVSSHSSGASRHFDQQVVRPVRYSGIERRERLKFSVADRKHCFVIVAEMEGPPAYLVHVGR